MREQHAKVCEVLASWPSEARSEARYRLASMIYHAQVGDLERATRIADRDIEGVEAYSIAAQVYRMAGDHAKAERCESRAEEMQMYT